MRTVLGQAGKCPHRSCSFPGCQVLIYDRYQGSWGVAEKVTELALQYLKKGKVSAKL